MENQALEAIKEQLVADEISVIVPRTLIEKCRTNKLARSLLASAIDQKEQEKRLAPTN
jgi:hypothetical protein